MKKLFFISIIATSSLIIYANPPFADHIGDGTEYNPYRIYTREHLLELHDSIINIEFWSYNKHFLLMQDIDSVDFVIGFKKPANHIYSFMGYLHGNSKKITLTFDTSNSFQWLALFFYSTGIIDNLIVDGYLEASINNIAVAGIVCFNAGAVTRCTNRATIVGFRSAAGIIYENYGIIKDCVNEGTITVLPRSTGTTTAQ